MVAVTYGAGKNSQTCIFSRFEGERGRLAARNDRQGWHLLHRSLEFWDETISIPSFFVARDVSCHLPFPITSVDTCFQDGASIKPSSKVRIMGSHGRFAQYIL